MEEPKEQEGLHEHMHCEQEKQEKQEEQEEQEELHEREDLNEQDDQQDQEDIEKRGSRSSDKNMRGGSEEYLEGSSTSTLGTQQAGKYLRNKG